MNPVALKLTEAMRLWEAHPTTGATARKSDGVRVHPRDPSAVCWCSLGSLTKVHPLSPDGYPSNEYREAYSFLLAASRTVTGYHLAQSNDHTEFMPDIWTEAIEAAEALG